MKDQPRSEVSYELPPTTLAAIRELVRLAAAKRMTPNEALVHSRRWTWK